MTLRIGNGAGFLGDSLSAPRRLAEAAALDVLTLEYLAELTLSILARLREKNAREGYAADLLTVLADLTGVLQQQSQLKIVTNGGGMNPLCCARAAAEILHANDLAETRVAAVAGDDLLERLPALQAEGCRFENLDTGQPLAELNQPIVSANAYLGAAGIVDALNQDARVVITGRVADASLTVGPAVHHFGWKWRDWQRLAAASVAGHLIECGAQVTGGFYPHWQGLNLEQVGYPIAELDEDGNCVITKPAGSGGVVNRETVCEQLVYEIGDPAHYLTPDVDVNFSKVEVAERGPNRVAVWGAQGRAAPPNYKVSLAYRAGFTASGTLLVHGKDCVAKARECARIILARVQQAGFELQRTQVECLGAGDGVPGRTPPPADLREVMLRVSVQDMRAAAVERFTRELAPLATAGPAGLAGYAAGRPTVRPVFAYWPTLIARELVQHTCTVRTAREWCTGEVSTGDGANASSGGAP